MNKKKIVHEPEKMSVVEKRVVATLGNRIGRQNAIKMPDLAEIAGTNSRKLRYVINHLKFEHQIPILSWDHPIDGGYYLAADQSDQDECIHMFMSRIWTSLKNVAAIKKVSLIEAGELFAVELTEKSDDAAKIEFMRGLPEPPPGYSLITALATHAQSRPEKYQKDLHNLQNIFGAKFIERKKIKELAEVRKQLNELCAEFEEDNPGDQQEQ